MEEILLDIYNTVWSLNSFPEDWRKYQVFFIDKVGKEKVRPIALSSCVGKLENGGRKVNLVSGKRKQIDKGPKRI